MTRAFFSDTSAWFAAIDVRQEHHAKAAATVDGLRAGGALQITTNLVLAELHALASRRRDPAFALGLLDSAATDPSVLVIHTDSSLEAEAVDRWLRVFRDQRFSLCDAVSFEVMRRERVRTAFALDRHFRAAGYDLVPEPR